METQKTLNSQGTLEKEEWNWRNQHSCLQIIPKPEINPMGTLFLTKEARIYNGAKTASTVNGAGITGQLHVKE